jgi:dihydrolipoamide dehydrogenase
MATEVNLPALGESVTEGTVTRWLKQVGDTVAVDEPLLEVSTYSYNLGGNGKSQILKTQGFVKLVRVNDGPVVGVHMVGARMGELVGEAQLIYNWEAFPDEVAQLVHAHPTQNEALGEAFLALAGKPLHAHA